jgi:uncharacterized OB-fold protein
MVLVATKDSGREEIQFPPSEYVHGDAVLQEVEIGPLGKLYTYTIVHTAKDKPPYVLAMVDFAPGVRVFGHLLQEEGRPVIGGDVCVVPFALPDGSPDYAFRAV